MARLCSLAWLGLVALALTVPAGAAVAEEPDLLDPDLDPRELPSLVVRWRCHCRPAAAAVGPRPGGGAVYVQGHWRFFALDAETHELLWDQKLEEVASPVGRPLVLGDRLAVVYRDRVFLVEPVSGVVVAEVEVDGLVEHAVGPPLAVALNRYPEGAGRLVGEVLRIDEASGQVVARRELRVLGLVAEDGRVLAVRALTPAEAERVGDGASAPERLVELAPDDLATVRGWPGADALVLRASRGGSALVPFEAAEDGVRYRWARDLVDGAGAGPSTAPRPRAGFHDLDAELQAQIPSGPESTLGLRRLDPETGEILWTRELPHTVGARLWDGERLLVHTRPRQGGRGLLVTLDAGSGAVLGAAYGLAGVRSLERWGELVIAVTGDEVVAFEADELGAPEATTRSVADEVDRLLSRIGDRRLPFVDRDVARELDTLGEEALPVLLERLPELAPQAALTVTSTLSAARHRPAAPRLAELLHSFPDPPEGAPPEWTNAHPEVLILTALGRLGGPDEVPAVGTVLLDDTEALAVRERALTALAELGGPEAVRWVDRFYGSEATSATLESAGAPADAPPGPGVPAVAHLSDEDRMRLAIVRHFATFRRLQEEVPLCVVADRPLPWSAGVADREVVTVGSVEEAPGASCGTTIRPGPATEEQLRQYLEHQSEPAPGERLWVLSAGVGSFGEGHWVVLRPVDGRWLVRSMMLWWIA